MRNKWRSRQMNSKLKEKYNTGLFLKKAYESFSESAYADELNLRAYIMQVCAEILKTRNNINQ